MFPPPSDPLLRVIALARRHPRLALGLLERLAERAEADDNPALAVDTLCARFQLLERLGQAGELELPLSAALQRCQLHHLPRQAAQCHEALGRIHYQRGEYQDAGEHWSQAVDLARLVGDTRSAVAARIGLGQIHHALGNWAAGRRFLDEAAHWLREVDDSYLRAKLALNRGVSRLHEGGPQAGIQAGIQAGPQAGLTQARTHFQQGLEAALHGGHTEYEAEALWQLARVDLAEGQIPAARHGALRALQLAERLGHHWLQGMALQTLTELALAEGAPDQALELAQRALALAEQLGSREQQATLHLRLARLRQDGGQPDAALRHLWSHVELQAQIERLAPPERVGVLDRFDPASQAPEELLLNLSNRDCNPASVAELESALLDLSVQAQAIMGLDRLQFWWDQDGRGRFQRFPAPEGAPPAALLHPLHTQYLDLITQRQEPLALADLRLHPCAVLLALVDGAMSAESRIELPLRRHGQVVALLWLEQQGRMRAWSRSELLQASHIGHIFERLLMGLDLVTALGSRAAMEQEKLALQARLVASIAHDVNTPIGIAVTASSALGDSAQRLSRLLAGERVSRSELQQLAGGLDQAAQLVQANLQRAAELIGSFKRMAVDQASEAVVSIHLTDYVRQLVSVHSPALTKAGIQCQLDIPPGLMLELVAGHLSQVLSNLIMNALAHAFPDRRGGSIAIRAHAEGEGPARRVLLEVADDGIGLPPELRQRVFEPFFTTKRGRGGSGLGLHIVQSMVQRLGGTVDLPLVPRGLTVRLALPVRPAEAQAAPAAPLAPLG